MTMLAFSIALSIALNIVFAIEFVQNQYSDDNQYNSHIARCEYSALKLGSDLADVFNAPIGHEDWDQRVHQDFITEHLGFAPWMISGISGTDGLTLTNKKAGAIAEKGGWFGRNISDSPYSILNRKWIYMLGDSTTRQVWASFAAPFQGNNFERNAKEWSRQYCNRQAPHRLHHPRDGHFPEEGWAGPCGSNEITCHVSGFGEGGLLSYDWKHFTYEDYDEYLWGNEGPFIKGFSGEGNRRPDVLTVQFGLHTCVHARPEGAYSGFLNGTVNDTMIEDQLRQIPKLMAAIRRAVDPANSQKNDPNSKARNPTMVIIVTSGGSGMGDKGIMIDACVNRFNRATVKAAHEQGFAVLDRGEIERRLMHKSSFTDSPILIAEMHLPQPAQNIIATTLTHLMTCMNSSIVNGAFVYEKIPEKSHLAPPQKSVSVPPA